LAWLEVEFSAKGDRAIGYNGRNYEIRDNITRMRQEWEVQRGTLATVRRFNATPSAKAMTAALTSKHPLASHCVRQPRHGGAFRSAR